MTSREDPARRDAENVASESDRQTGVEQEGRVQSAVRAEATGIGWKLGNQLLRGILGGLMRGR